MDNQERLKVFTNMAAADPENELAHFSLGKVQLEIADAAAAEKSFRRVLELNARHSQAHRLLGEALLRQGRKDDAVLVLRNGIAVAHEKGEYQPRNQMQDLLRKEGVEPPLPQAASAATTGAAPGTAGASAAASFVCRRCGQPNPRLDEPPFLNDLGRRIENTICQPCWREWIAMSIKVINEYRLNLLSPQGNEIYETHMKEFLGLEG
jgi:Fe-S cluster biosynthesis and repair protein YggX